jgi:hypothetical protein
MNEIWICVLFFETPLDPFSHIRVASTDESAHAIGQSLLPESIFEP